MEKKAGFPLGKRLWHGVNSIFQKPRLKAPSKILLIEV
jgi:hypothetical protein